MNRLLALGFLVVAGACAMDGFEDEDLGVVEQGVYGTRPATGKVTIIVNVGAGKALKASWTGNKGEFLSGGLHGGLAFTYPESAPVQNPESRREDGNLRPSMRWRAVMETRYGTFPQAGGDFLWTFENIGSHLCMTAPLGNSAETKISDNKCKGADADSHAGQLWWLTNAGEMKTTNEWGWGLQSLCLEMVGNNVEKKPCNGTDTQKWEFRQVADYPELIDGSRYNAKGQMMARQSNTEIGMPAVNGNLFLFWQPNGTTTGRQNTANTANLPYAKWIAIRNTGTGRTTYRLKNVWNNKCLTYVDTPDESVPQQGTSALGQADCEPNSALMHFEIRERRIITWEWPRMYCLEAVDVDAAPYNDDGITINGAQVVKAPCRDTNAQIWDFFPTP